MDQNSQINSRSLPKDNLKVALFYDWLNQWGGAEKVLLDLIKLYPDAPIYTLVYDPKKTSWLPKNVKVITSFINKLPFSKKNNIFYTPLYSIALEQFDFSQYDVVISTTSVSGHCLITQPETLFLCYLHNINRYVYQTPKQFLFLKVILDVYKKIDYIFAKRPDYLLCNSKTVQERILKNYNRPSEIIYPGIDTSFFVPSSKKTDEKYFLIVSRLVSHKKIDLAIKACHQLNLNLKIVGKGRQKKELTNLINSLNDKNIKILRNIDDQKLLNLYQNCQALICPQIEDFGLTPIEAQACGKPIIAFNQGGITETVIDHKTGIFFNKQSVKSLVKALAEFQNETFSPQNCVNNAARFSNHNFMLNFNQTVKNLWKKHQNKSIVS
ncbi:MAG: glycosyltransferase [Candidatus Shapirobacteria bacterium]